MGKRHYFEKVYHDDVLSMMVTFMRSICSLSCLSLVLLLAWSCSKKEPIPDNNLTLEQEQRIGYDINASLMEHLDQDPNKTPLERADYPNLYRYVNELVMAIQQAPHYQEVLYAQHTPVAAPRVLLLDAPSNTGAFIAPGGYIYVYNDLLKSIETEAQFVAILSHLMVCSAHRLDIEKLENKFSRKFLFDIALGGGVNSGTNPSIAATGTSLHAVLMELEEDPYDDDDIERVDEEVEHILCELDYDVRSYSSLHQRATTAPLKWLNQFPRDCSSSDYAMHLFNDLSNAAHCTGQMAVEGYSAFQMQLP